MSIKQRFLITFFTVLCLAAALILQSVAAKSVYLSANHHTGQFDAWNIGSDGLVSKHGTYNLQYSTDPAGIGIDAITENDEPIMFISSEFSPGLEIVNPVSLEYIGVSSGPSNLGGVDVDDADDIVYSLRRQTSTLYIFQWDPVAQTMTQLAYVNLPGMSYGYGIALDDSRDILWVSDCSNRMIRAYDVNVSGVWSNIAEVPSMSFSVSHVPVDVTVDSKRNIVYSGGGWAGSPLISKYDLTTGTETTVNCGGAMGIAVDEITGYVYITRGGSYGGGYMDDLEVWDCSTDPFTLLQSTPDLGNPAGLAIANQGQVAVNPLNLAKNDVVQGVGVPIGQDFTYEISFDNFDNTVDVSGVMVRDDLPPELDFVSETIGGVAGTGVYDPVAHTVTWDVGTILAGEAGPLIELVVNINDNAVEGQTIYNFADIWGDEVDTSTVVGDDPDDTTNSGGTTPIQPEAGNLSGLVIANCPDDATELNGIKICIYDSDGYLVACLYSDVNGVFEQQDLDAGNYEVVIQTPLGYTSVPDEQTAYVVGGETVTVTFALTCHEIVTDLKTRTYWCAQVSRALAGYPNDYSLEDLSGFVGLFARHFNANTLNPVTHYCVPQPASQTDSLVALKKLLYMQSDNPDESYKYRKAKAQLITLMLNVAAGKIHQTAIVSADGMTVADAITYCDQLIDGSIPVYEPRGAWFDYPYPTYAYVMAGYILTLVNNAYPVPADMIYKTITVTYRPTQETALPTEFALYDAYPNPFNPTTTISYMLPEATDVTIEVFNINGQRVATLVSAYEEAGKHSVVWDGMDSQGQSVASGIYLYRLQTGNDSATKKMLLLK